MRVNCRRLFFLRMLLLLAAVVPVGVSAIEVIPDHPRLLLRKDDLPGLRERARTTHATEYARMREWADVQVELGGRVDAVALGLLYQISGDPKYLEKIRADWAGGGEYRGVLASGCLDRRGSSAEVYDLVYEGLDPEEKEKFAARLFASGKRIALLAAYGDTADEARARGSLEMHAKAFGEYRDFYRKLAGRRGGWMMSFFCGCLRPYPEVLECWRNATGENHWGDGMQMVGMNAHHLSFRIPFEGILERQSNIRGTETCSKYGTWLYARGAQDGFATWVLNHPEEVTGRGKDLGVTTDLAVLGARWRKVFKELGQYKETYPSISEDPGALWEPLLYRDPGVKERSPTVLSTTSLHEGLGLVSMRSSWQDDATFATFKCGSWEHGEPIQMDDNTFSIRKLGTLVKRNGGADKGGDHSISHNTILVHDPKEQIQVAPVGVMGSLQAVPSALNDGGQSAWKSGHLGINGRGQTTAFESNDRFDYMVGDASRSYHSGKLKGFTRQFVYLKPDYFVVYDRIESTKPEFKKTWVLHTKSEPVIEGDALTVDAEELGFNRTVYPWYTSRAFSVPEYENEKTDWERVSGKTYDTNVFREVLQTKVPNRTCRLKLLIPADGAELAFLYNVGPEYGTAQWSMDDGRWSGAVEQHGKERSFFVRKVLVDALPAGEHEIKLSSPDSKINVGMFLLKLGGRLFCKTLLPEKYERTWQFGFGTKFDTEKEKYSQQYASQPHSRYGGHRDYRVDLSPVEAQAKDHFLHVFQATTRRTPKMVPVRQVREEGRVGAELVIDGKAVTVTFNVEGEVGGHIRAEGLDRDFTREILDRDEPALVESLQRVHDMKLADYPVAAVAALAQADVETLSAALTDARWHVRFYAARLLVHRKAKEAAPHLAKVLSDSDVRVAGAAADALGRLSAVEQRQPLLAALGSKSAHVRQESASALGRLRAESSSAPLALLRSDPDALVSAAAVRALGHLESPNAEALLEALDTAAPEARIAACRALIARDERRAVPPARKLATSPDAGVRAVALRLLVALDGKDAREPLRHALGDSEIRIRFYAARELQKLGDHAGTSVLVEAAGNDEAFPLDRVEAVQLLGLSGDARAVEPLKRIGGARISFQYPTVT